MFLLHKNAIQIKEREGYLPAVYAVLFQRVNRAQLGGLHRHHHCEDPIEK
jgi:hypothetical protein